MDRDWYIAWARIAAWCCILATAALSLLPAENIQRSSIGGHVEHVLAYAVTSIFVALAYPAWRLAWILAALMVYAASLEYLQHFSPGRSPSILDFTFSGLGICGGLLIRVAPIRTK
jgi:VanZ family protein